MKDRTTRSSRLLYDLLNRSAQDAGSIVYAPPLMAQFGFPARKLSTNEFERHNGLYKYSLVAPSDIGLPYGLYPRCILIFLATEVRLTQSRFVDLGVSRAAFKKKLGIGIGGGATGPSNRFNDQFKRLFTSSLKVIKESESSFEVESVNLANKAYAVWQPPVGLSMTGVLELETSFYEDLSSKSFPVDQRALKYIGAYCLAHDLYIWLTFRVYNLKRPVQIQWLQLELQFGNQFSTRSSFKHKFKAALCSIKTFWPSLKVQLNQRGLLITPCSPHVAKEGGRTCV